MGRGGPRNESAAALNNLGEEGPYGDHEAEPGRWGRQVCHPGGQVKTRVRQAVGRWAEGAEV